MKLNITANKCIYTDRLLNYFLTLQHQKEIKSSLKANNIIPIFLVDNHLYGAMRMYLMNGLIKVRLIV